MKQIFYPWKRPDPESVDIKSLRGSLFVVMGYETGDLWIFEPCLTRTNMLTRFDRRLCVGDDNMLVEFNVTQAFSQFDLNPWCVAAEAYFGSASDKNISRAENSLSGRWLQWSKDEYPPGDENSRAQLRMMDKLMRASDQNSNRHTKAASDAKWDEYVTECLKLHRSTVPMLKYILTDKRTLTAEQLEEI